MSLGHRDQRVEIYAYLDSGADGFVESEYRLRYVRWGRLESPTGREVTVGGQAEQVVDAVLVVAWETPIGEDDAVRVDGLVYRVLAVLPRRAAHERQALLARADDALPKLAPAAIGGPGATMAGIAGAGTGTVT